MSALPFAVYATAGDAVFTLESQRTGRAYTFQVQAGTDPGDPYWVRLLTGPDNTSDFTYLGLIQRKLGPGCMEFRTTKKSPPADSTPVRAFEFSWRHRTRLAEFGVNFRPSGKCCRCGRPLTTPESIDRGIGPECAARMGG